MGLLIHQPEKDINIQLVEAAKEAALMGSTRTFNMIVLGAYLKVKPLVNMDKCDERIEEVTS
jgi:2-oxoglutarate ferredoxin oxidoreductase subunit gamma